MANVVANVLAGVAVLSVRQPNDAIAEWATAPIQAGTYSVKLYKAGTGTPGSTHVEFTPINTAIKFSDFCTSVDVAHPGADYSYYHYESVTDVLNWTQFELRFEDPTAGSKGFVEITAVRQNVAGVVGWNIESLDEDTQYGCGGNTPNASSVFYWTAPLPDMAGIQAEVQALFNAAEAGSGTQLLNYLLTRIRIELWEVDARTVHVDTVVIDGDAHPLEISSATTPGLTLGSPYTEVGYTEDGVTLEYTADTADLEVEEETFPIARVITKETLAITCNMAESSLDNINNAMTGAVRAADVITLDAGVNKTMNLKIKGTNPAGFIREIYVPLASTTGAVGMSYKKGEKTVVPVTFQAIKGTSDACTIVDNVV